MDSRNIPYMIIGGQAVLLYGEPRLTRDIDITLGVDIEKLPEIISLTKECRLKILTENPKDFVQKTWVLPTFNKESGFRVDFIFSWSPYEKEALSRVRIVNIENYPVKFASPEDVIIHKMLAGRPRDFEDIKSILRKQKVNKKLITYWLKIFSQGLKKDLQKEFESLWQEVQNEL
ncbi:nucleotidyl transferase AbiEii/AbiGii toxin family protein [Desulfurobacterium sp.]|uniref:nucleotidyl transferase AbiEii/AbiGii toxin family protein n=1 Tax=Desulfurobacterium sp. TaxID=2004706 RepID=UPI0026304E39|nr:nucleotidyl transferase AbiEii/AbiGii toxin family protein [Desulfurobacterium sp.]